MKNKTDESSLDSLGEMIKNLALKCSAVTSGIRLGPGATDEEKFVIYLKGCCEQSKRLDESMTKQLWLITSLLRTLFTFIFEGIDDEQVKQQCKKIFFDSIPRNALVLVILYSKLYVFKGDEVLKDVPVEVTEKEIRELFHMTNDQIFEELMAGINHNYTKNAVSRSFLFLHEVRECLKVILLTFLFKKIYPRCEQEVKLKL